MTNKVPIPSVFGPVILLLAIVAYFSFPITKSFSKEDDISFLWSFVVLKDPQDKKVLAPVTSSVILHSGDKFKLMFEALSNCYVYIVFKGSTGEIVQLYPETTFKSRPAEINRNIILPDTEGWFTLDEYPGTETLYLLVSSGPLMDLESLLKQYKSASPDEREPIARSVEQLIRKEERSRKPLTAEAEKPIQIGGTIRNIPEHQNQERNISNFAAKISTTDLYVRTFSIEHR